MYKQIIIVNKKLGMTGGKLSAQVCHASEAFLYQLIKENATKNSQNHYDCQFTLEQGIIEEWINNNYTKAVLQAKNRNHLEKAVNMAKELGFIEGRDYFCIHDMCKTELTPDNENGTCWTCIGFTPMAAEKINPIASKYHLYTESASKNENIKERDICEQG